MGRAFGTPIGREVPFVDMKEAVTDSLVAPTLKLSEHGKHARKGNPDSLSNYCLVVDAGGQSAPIRLDHALPMLRMPDDGCDCRGEQVRFVQRVSVGGGAPAWTLVYALREDGNVPLKSRGSVDHVLPRAAGGEDRLYNMQMMRLGSNAAKGSGKLDPDPGAEAVVDAIRILGTLRSGLAKASGKARVLARLSDLVDVEIRAARRAAERAAAGD